MLCIKACCIARALVDSGVGGLSRARPSRLVDGGRSLSHDVIDDGPPRARARTRAQGACDDPLSKIAREGCECFWCSVKGSMGSQHDMRRQRPGRAHVVREVSREFQFEPLHQSLLLDRRPRGLAHSRYDGGGDQTDEV